jgi:glycosyltransferase involved in cell wall biosynthesis
MITIVSPWYGPDTAGGAETQARSLAQAMRRVGAEVRVWASTGRDSFHPANVPADVDHYPAGHSTVDEIPVWRFRPDSAQQQNPGREGVPRFFQKHPHLLPPLEQFSTHELRLLGTLLSSDELYEAILAEQMPNHRFIFIPYAFPTTFWGALIAPTQSYVLPCLHDEPYARYSTYRYLFSQVRGILCNSHPERELALRLYDVEEGRVYVPGEGIDLTPRGDGQRFRERYRERLCCSPDSSEYPKLLLYAGRRDESKNIGLLLAYAREYWARRGSDIRLLLAGRDHIDHTSVPPSLQELVVDLGYLEQQAKHDAYAAADIFIQPSLYESFSIVLMEAWLQGTPALVHGDCAVTADHCRRSGGGLSFDSFGSFAAALDILLPQPALRAAMGERGRQYVLATCCWEEVARQTLAAVNDV